MMVNVSKIESSTSSIAPEHANSASNEEEKKKTIRNPKKEGN